MTPKTVLVAFLAAASLNAMAEGLVVPAKYADTPLLSAFPTVSMADWDSFSKEEWIAIMEENRREPTTQRFPGYKKGTKRQDESCGVPGPDMVIAGGQETTPHEYPWMVSVFMTRGNDTYFCGGTLISEEWVLTAAHCVDDFDFIDVFLGAHNVSQEQEDGRLELRAAEFFTHPDWIALLIRNDVGLIRLESPIEFSDTIRPVCLPTYADANEPFANLTLPATGWGKPGDDAEGISDVLREVDVETMSNERCAAVIPTVTADNICITGDDGKSTCPGDSGGPMHFIMESGQFKQIGITSFGFVFGCEIGLPAGFARTASFLEFIETNTGIIIDP